MTCKIDNGENQIPRGRGMPPVYKRAHGQSRRLTERGWRCLGSKDVARAQMGVERLPFGVEQLELKFPGVTDNDRRIAVGWDRAMASVFSRLGIEERL